MTDLIFSSYNYYENSEFVRLMRNWNKYLEYEGDDVDNDDLMAEWEELCIKDFRDAANIWYSQHSISWGSGLE